MGFQLVSKSVTLNDLERWKKNRYFGLFYRVGSFGGPVTSKRLKIDPYYLWQKCSTANAAFSDIWVYD